MSKLVLDVGNCAPDHSSIKQFAEQRFDCEVVQAHGMDDAIRLLAERDFALVLINRKLDHDYSDGVEVLKAIKSDSKAADVPVMIVTNLPEHQEAAMALGAERGFGKLELEKPETAERLAKFLAP